MKFEYKEAKTGLEAGTYPVRIVGVVDLGTQEKEFDGKKSFARQVVLQFEFPTETFMTEDGKELARTLSNFYTASLNPKATLRKHLEQVRGRGFTQEELEGFEVRKLLGVAATATVVVNTNGKPKIGGVGGPMKGATQFKKMTDHTFFDLDNFDQATFDTLPDFLKNIIQMSPEYLQATQKEESIEDIGNLF